MTIHEPILGGMFGQEPTAPESPRSDPPFARPGDLWLVNARSALDVLCEQLRPPRVWLPAYLCPVLIDVVVKRRIPLEFFDALPTRPLPASALAEVRAGELVVVIDYFGFPVDSMLLAALRQRGATVVEDACQALLSTSVGLEADYVLYSPRKFLGVAEGGLLGVRHGRPLDVPLAPAPQPWLDEAQQAADARACFDRGQGDRRWYAQFQHVEATQPCGPLAIGDRSREVLQTYPHFSCDAQRRRANFARLHERLSNYSPYSTLPPEVVPLGYPIVLANRESVQRALFAANMFPPVHWPLAGHVPAEFVEAHRLSERLLTLPLDQRCSFDRLDAMAEIVRREGAPCPDT